MAKTNCSADRRQERKSSERGISSPQFYTWTITFGQEGSVWTLFKLVKTFDILATLYSKNEASASSLLAYFSI